MKRKKEEGLEMTEDPRGLMRKCQQKLNLKSSTTREQECTREFPKKLRKMTLLNLNQESSGNFQTVRLQLRFLQRQKVQAKAGEANPRIEEVDPKREEEVAEARVDQDTEVTDQDQGSEDQDLDPVEEAEVDTDPEEVGADIDQEEVKVEIKEVEVKVKEYEVNLAVSLEVGEIEVTTKIPSLRSRRKYQE